MVHTLLYLYTFNAGPKRCVSDGRKSSDLVIDRGRGRLMEEGWMKKEMQNDDDGWTEVEKDREGGY